MDGQEDTVEDGIYGSTTNVTKRLSFAADKIPKVQKTSNEIELRLDAERLLSAFGKYGKYQMRTYILLTLPAFFFSSQMLIMGFIAHAPPFQCVIDTANASASSSFPSQITYKVLDNCHVLDLKSNNVVQCLAVPNATYLYTETVPHSTINSEFDLVCNKQHWAEHGSSLFMLGGILTPVVTQLSDLYGRRKVFLLTLWSAGFASVACSVAPTIHIFLFCRFILGITITGLNAVIWIMSCETVAVEFRSLIPIGFAVTWVLGIMIVGLLRMWILNWRWLYFVISVPNIFTVFYYWLLPESPHWLISHNKQRAIGKYIEDACNYNNMKINVCKCESVVQQTDERYESRTFMDILRNKVALFHLIVQCYVMAAMNITYWGMALLSTTLSEDSYTGYFLSGFIELPGGLLAVLLLLKFGRRSISMWSFMMQSVLQSLTILFPGLGVMQLLLALSAKLFNCFIWSAQPLLLAEMSPTTVRNTFYGAVQFFAEIGSISAPYLPLLKNINHRAPQAAVAVFSFTAALLLLTAPETKDRAMPEDLDQFDPGYFLRMFGYREQRKRSILLTPKEVEEVRKVPVDLEVTKLLKMKNDEENAMK